MVLTFKQTYAIIIFIIKIINSQRFNIVFGDVVKSTDAVSKNRFNIFYGNVKISVLISLEW